MKTEYDKLPDDALRETLRACIEEGRPTGGFLRAVLANDLMGSFGGADDTNRYRLFDIVSWLYNNAPSGCLGDYQAVDKWIEQGGLGGS